MERNLCIFPKNQPPKLEQQQHPPIGMLILPEDLLVEILSRLPVRHLMRLRCVCKSWCILIDDVNFIKRHYWLQYSICKEDGDIPFMCWGPETVYMHSPLHVRLLSKQNGDVFVDLTADLVCDSEASFTNAPDLFDQAVYVGVVNGVVCFVWGFHDLGLWNPTTREFKAITPWLNHPIQPNCLYLIGFGFDCISNDLKIVRGNFSEDETLSHEVYSLTSNSWKRLREQPPPYVRGCKGTFTLAYLNGVCYWCVLFATTMSINTPAILSFNFSTEVFGFFILPQNAYDWTKVLPWDWTITVYKERLAFVVTRPDMKKDVRNFDVWVVTEFHDNSEIPVSWQHLLTIGPFGPSSDVLHFDTFRMDSDVLFKIKSSVLKIEEESGLYYPSTGTLKNLGFIPSIYFEYVESLFPLSRKIIRS